jgi:hypothetical protein
MRAGNREIRCAERLNSLARMLCLSPPISPHIGVPGKDSSSLPEPDRSRETVLIGMWSLVKSTAQVRQNTFNSSPAVKMVAAPERGEAIPHFGGAVAFYVRQ